MQLLFFIRSEIVNLHKFYKGLSQIHLNFTYKDFNPENPSEFVNGTQREYLVQLMIRPGPFGIHELVFPEEHRDLVLNTFLGDGKGFNTKYSNVACFLSRILGMAMGLQRIPKYARDKKIPFEFSDIEIIPIGLKPDKKDSLGNENI